MLERVTRGVKILMVLHFVGWLLTPLLGKEFASALIMDPGAVLDGQLWRLLSYPLIVDGAMGLLWTLVGLFFIGSTVEARIGTRALFGLYAVSTVAAGVALLLFDLVVGNAGYLMGPWAAGMALLAAFVRLGPNAKLLYMFVLPIRASWILGFAIAMRFMVMWDVQRIVWPSLAELTGVAVGWMMVGGRWSLGDFNPVERYRNWRYRQRMQKLTVVSGGKKTDPSQYLH